MTHGCVRRTIIPAIFGYPRRTFGTRPAVPEPGSMVMRVRMPVASRRAPSRRRQCGGVGGAILLLAVVAQPETARLGQSETMAVARTAPARFVEPVDEGRVASGPVAVARPRVFSWKHR